MIARTMIFAALCATLAACEKEEGVGFTGIGPAATQSLQTGYALDFQGLKAVSRTASAAQ